MLVPDPSMALDFGFFAAGQLASWPGVAYAFLPALAMLCVVLVLSSIIRAIKSFGSLLRRKRPKGQRSAEAPVAALS